MQTQSRQPKGLPVGGQFATDYRASAPITLSAEEPGDAVVGASQVPETQPIRSAMKSAFDASAGQLQHMPSWPGGIGAPHIATSVDEDGITVAIDFEHDGQEWGVSGWRYGPAGDFEISWENGDPPPPELTAEQVAGIGSYLRTAHANASVLQGVVERQLAGAGIYELMGDALNQKAGVR